MPVSISSCVKFAFASAIPTAAGYETTCTMENFMQYVPAHPYESGKLYFKSGEIPAPFLTKPSFIALQIRERSILKLVERVNKWIEMRRRSSRERGSRWTRIMKKYQAASYQELMELEPALQNYESHGDENILKSAMELIMDFDEYYAPRAKFFAMSRDDKNGGIILDVQTVSKNKYVVKIHSSIQIGFPGGQWCEFVKGQDHKQYNLLIKLVQKALLGQDPDLCEDVDSHNAQELAKVWFNQLQTDRYKDFCNLVEGKSGYLGICLDEKTGHVVPL